MIGKILVLVLRFGFVIFRDRNLRNLQLLQASNLRVSIAICLIAMLQYSGEQNIRFDCNKQTA